VHPHDLEGLRRPGANPGLFCAGYREVRPFHRSFARLAVLPGQGWAPVIGPMAALATQSTLATPYAKWGPSDQWTGQTPL
jgi:hypothetical protein